MAYKFNIFTGTFDQVGPSGGGGTTVNKTTAIVNFGTATSGETDTVYTTVSAPWVTSSTVLIASFGGPTTDHDLDDAAIENIILSTGNIVNGVSFDIIAHTDNFSWGQYQVNILGV